MNPTSYVFTLVAALLAVGVVIERLRRRRLRERHAVWWLVAGIVALVISVFPPLLSGAARFLGVQEPLNLAFFASIVVIFLVCVQFSAELTDLEDKVRRLAEESAMTDLRLRDLEQEARAARVDASPATPADRDQSAAGSEGRGSATSPASPAAPAPAASPERSANTQNL
ncbi:DUF2304 domain-containing protein [Clavibacter michiganensis]|uniref:Membrane protein n=2 Tax=Clavibacter michiganensis subsp. insidiosus TaxID=33014 RepID=A0A0D5CJR1_9MICO|nr:DUF2304 domain-containing protein [Clavibacter michiganensis]AJW79539.1 membrane protein [Clavibacter michiganensis subsp. insidiosus]AWG02096.1 membrane protein [Clavibacter michiganensis subsp. insidiosus]OQJ59421.1 hypothetical protein B5P21_05545 [Clavibacter michiganensis subsp. insidiosus]RII87528.1 DUF2304 domain-containing protein [Clavibacter michiganensis subsp. insidiosus]RMC87892.1 DUF2304 domain-containing protein [Clavibacter michiganensis subsp. insidiosus]